MKSNGNLYWEYVFIYIDDVIAMLEHPNKILQDMNKHFLFKEGLIGPPTRYLGANISEYFITGDLKSKWAIESQDYMREAVRVISPGCHKEGCF